MNKKIFLNSFDSKKSVNTSSSVSVKLKGNRRLLPLNDVGEIINQHDLYMEERRSCNKIRLTCQVNAVCSNVLFNKVTEIVKREGSDNVVNINYGIGNDKEEFTNVIYKPKTMDFWSSGAMSYQSTDQKVNELGYNRGQNISVIIEDKRHNDDGIITSQLSHPTNAIRDTQLSNTDSNGEHFVYHCGLDFLNNHLIRSNTFRMVCKMPSENYTNYFAFNTIADLMRDVDGNKICEKYYFPIDANVPGGAKYIVMHLYDLDKIDKFEDAVENKLKYKYNGWVGFENTSKIKSYDDFKKSDELNIERPLMYYNSGDFVDMYPSRDLFSFVPKYNTYQNRLEKNWNYCITYPSSSYTPSSSDDAFSDIIESNDGINSLKAIYFDENTKADNGLSQLVIYSISKHGLNVGDYVNIYRTYTSKDNKLITEKIVDNAEVFEVVDEYIFTVYNSYLQISNTWVYLSDSDLKGDSLSVNNVTYTKDNSKKFYTDNESNRYYIVNGRYVNFDKNAQNISYKKVVGDIECEYYIRIFSKLPNFKFASASTDNEYELYKDNGKTISDYQSKEYDFENHLSRLAFAKNIYSDDIAEIVFTDDIDLSYLKDNLGRPLSSLYLTIIKNNQGYKEWYGYHTVNNWNKTAINDEYENVEFSHCFGMVTCGIDASEESLYDDDVMSIKKINNIDHINGYNVSAINGGETRRSKYRNGNYVINDFEVSYDVDKHFYGDLCYYDAYNAIERPIQQILHRFNTAQRECGTVASSNIYYSNFMYDEIEYDDYDCKDAFIMKSYKYVNNGSDVCSFKEGYYYKPHYEIPIRTFDRIEMLMPDFLSIREIHREDSCTYRIVTLQKHFLKIGDKAMLYDRIMEKYYILKTVENVNDNVFICTSYLDSDDEYACDITIGEDEEILENINPKDELYVSLKLFKIDNLNIPSYARVLKDGTCRIIWRDLLNNGDEVVDGSIEEYPFTNGAFYVNKRIDLYLRRQDPQDMWGLYSEMDMIGKETDIAVENDYAKEEEIEC